MKNSILLLLLAIVSLSSCSKRFGYVPKVKATPHKEVSSGQRKDEPKTTLSATTIKSKTLCIQPTNPTVPAIAEGIAIKEPAKPKLKEPVLNPATNHNKKDKAANAHKNKPQPQKQNPTQQKYRTCFWDTDFGYFLIDFGLRLALLVVLLFFMWLIEMGLGWLVAIILIALGIILLIALLDFLSDLASKMLFWSH